MQSTNVDAFNIDPSHVTADNLRDYLTHDNLFADYFNAFLSLPIFPVAYHYYSDKGLFTVTAELDVGNVLRPNEAHSHLSKKRLLNISARRHSFQPIPLLPMENNMKVHHESNARRRKSSLILNKRKGLQWIQNERLPLFLQSRLYAEYRLAKILSQVRLLRHDKTAVPDLYLSLTKLQQPPKVINSPIPEEVEDSSSEDMMESVHISFGDTSLSDIEAWQNNLQAQMSSQQKVSDSDLADMSESPNSEAATMFSSPNISPLPGRNTPPCILFADMDVLKPEIGPPVYVGPYCKQFDVPAVRIFTPKKNRSYLHVNNLHELSQMLIACVVKNALVEVEGISEEEVEESNIYQNLFPFYRKNSIPLTMDMFEKLIHFDKAVDRTADHIILTDLFGYERTTSNDLSMVLSVDDDKDECLENDYFDSGDQSSGCFSTDASIKEFQSFLKETSSEKNWFLWIDLEKFRLSKTDAGKETCILTIKNKYYNTTPHYELAVDLKTEIDIANWKSLTDEKVVGIQRKILEPFFQYWVPLYLLKKQIQADPSKYASYFTLKKLRQSSESANSTELERDVSIFVLKPSKSEEKKKAPVSRQQFGSFETMVLPPTEPNIGMRRTYLISALQHDSIAKNYKWRKGESKRCSVPIVKEAQKEKSTFIFREVHDLVKHLRPNRSSIVSSTPEIIWPKCDVKIVPVDKESESGQKVLPKELSCTKLLKVTQGTHQKQPTSSKDKDSFEENQKKEKYKLLSSLFNALKYEKASGDIFAVYLQEQHLKKCTNCLLLWDAISKFLFLYYNQPVIWPNVIRQVKFIHSEYLSESARQNVGCNPDIIFEIQENLNQPTGDMFKYVAEHVLAVLLPFWNQFLIEGKRKCVDMTYA